MAQLNVLHYPDERLRLKAHPVLNINNEIKTIVQDMFETMYAEEGIGLAATQVNIQLAIVVMDLSEDKSDPRVFINPEIISKQGETGIEEGCLSVPEIRELVPRAEQVTVRALDENGDLFELEADGLLAICIQHELDHLAGKLFVDYLSKLKRERIKQRLIKQNRRLQKR
jgi:peptide deformylase